MKLSDAIRLGAMLRPQAVGELFKDGGSCAIGAAIEACGISVASVDLNYDPIRAQWPWVMVMRDVAPGAIDVSEVAPIDALEIIWRLNDLAHWTREQIADYIATIEPQTAEPEVSLPSVAQETR